MNAGLGWVDGLIMLALLLAVTWAGHALSGAVRDRHGFFQAGGTLPWWAVAASIVATLVSSVTLISVPAAVFRDGGNLTYFQVVLGLAVGKLFIALLVARPYYEARGLHSSYDYIGARTDAAVGQLSMVLGLGLNVLNSAIKLLTASIVLDVITGWGVAGCAAVVTAFGVLWSALAGIKTVIWTDLLLFVLFSMGALLALGYLVQVIDTPLGTALAQLDADAKLVLFDFSTDPTVRYSLWAGVFGAICLSIAQATLQGTWQRVRACRSVGDAYRAYGYSGLFYVLHLVVLAIGLALAVFYAEQPLPASVQNELLASPDRIFPYFVISEIPPGFSGLFIAAIFAAAISTLDSALTEAADLSVRHLYEPLRPGADEAHYLAVSRYSLLFWGGAFYFAAVGLNRFAAEGLLDLTFKLPNYLTGVVFATVLLARLGIGRIGPFCIGALVSCGVVAWLAQQGIAFFYWCPVAGAAMFATVWLLDPRRPDWRG